MSRMSLLQQRVLRCAKEWWEAHRSSSMSEGQHVANPTVNLHTQQCLEQSTKLARAVAKLLEFSWETDEAATLVQDLLACSKGLEANDWRTCDAVINRAEIFRRAKAFLAKREVPDECLPQESRPRRLVRLHSRDNVR